MECREVADNDVAEAYVSGRLEDVERAAFEEHYFECQACARRVEACRALRQLLADRRGMVRGPGRRMPQWAWPLTAAAAAALAFVVLWPRPEPARLAAAGAGPTTAASAGDPAPTSLAALGRFEPPAYSSLTWRDSSPKADLLHSGMVRYARQDFEGAARDLGRAATSQAAAPEVHFFLGISLLLSGDSIGGAASLERTIGLGDTPYQEAARFYLAKAWLLRGDRRAAEAHLERTVALRGDLESQARRLLWEIGRLSTSRPPLSRTTDRPSR